MMCFGATMSMQWASDGPARWVLSSATAPPARVMPSQIAMYSGRFGIMRQTVSPLRDMLRQRPAGIAVRAFVQRPEAQAFVIRDERRRVAELLRQFLDDGREGAPRRLARSAPSIRARAAMRREAPLLQPLPASRSYRLRVAIICSVLGYQCVVLRRKPR